MVSKPLVRWFGFLIVLAGAFLLYRHSLAGLDLSSGQLPLAASATPTPTQVPPANLIYLPLANHRAFGPDLELDSVWTEDLEGNPQQAFLAEGEARLVALVNNKTGRNLPANLRWVQSGPCGELVLFDDAITLVPGLQNLELSIRVPDCLGYYIMTAELQALDKKLVDSALLVSNPPSRVGIDQHHGFDRCNPPTASQMQTWWNQSPYWVANLYIGGISLACDPYNLTPTWLNSVAQQGWTFIPTWVGPQAPCTDFRYRMSSNAGTAYQQGKDEAEDAVAAARDLGFLENMVIYYDIEGYPDQSACRDAVASFVRGWVEKLHQLGFQAGVYGSPCRSYISDWAEDSPVPDDIWIAHWIYDAYNSKATVGDVPDNIPCLADDLWPPSYYQEGNHQRIKQYTGGHTESWGGVSVTIDSNVLDGEVTVLQPPGTLADAIPGGGLPVEIQQVDLVTRQAGWARTGDRLLVTRDSGQSWQDITPSGLPDARLLAVAFADAETGWAVLYESAGASTGALTVMLTVDGGRTWQPSPVDLSGSPELIPISSASLDFLDERVGWLALDLQSGSAFSRGRLFATLDGGRTWTERSLPLGEPVRFQDAGRGWVAGGAGGDQLFRTTDGGQTWTALSLPQLADDLSGHFLADLPSFQSADQGLLPVTRVGLGPRLLVFATRDGGETWSLQDGLDLSREPGSPPAFSAFSNAIRGQGWAAGTPDAGNLWLSQDASQKAAALASLGLPQGLVSLEFVDGQAGWASVQDGSCQGQKLLSATHPSGGAPFGCESRSRLFRSDDGGLTWLEITPRIED